MTKRRFYIKCITAICCIGSSSGAYAQVASDTITERQVAEVTIMESSKANNTLAVSSTKQMDYSQMESANVMQLSDALKFFSGVAVKDYGGIGGLKTISIRGLGACHTAVAYDGVVQTDMQTGQIDLGRMSSLQIGSIKLVDGIDNDILQPAVLSASATTLNVESKKPVLLDGHGHQLITDIKFGSFNTTLTSVSMVEKISNKVMTSVSAEWLSTDGNYPYVQNNGTLTKTLNRDNSDVERIKTEVSLIADLSQYSHLSVKGYMFKSEQGLPSNILYNQNAANERIWNRDAFVQASLRRSIGDRWSTLSNLKYSNSSDRYKNSAVNNTYGVTDNRYTKQELYGSVAAMYGIGAHLSASFAEDIRLSALTGNGANQVSPKRMTLNGALSLKYVTEQTVLTARLNHIYSHETTKFREAADDYNHLSPTVGVNVRLTPDDGLHWRSSAKSTYRLPTFNDLYFEQVGRRDLRPEKAELYSMGLIWDSNESNTWSGNSRITLFADFFLNNITDKIVAVPGKSTAVWMMRNIGTVITKGVETGIDISSQVGNTKSGITGSFTYNRAMDKTEAGGTTYNHQIPYTPRTSGSCILYISTEYLNFSYNMFFSGEYYSNSYNGPEYRMPAYSEHGCSFWQNFEMGNTSIQVKGEVINLFDNRYEIVRNYPMPGVQYRIGMTINL